MQQITHCAINILKGFLHGQNLKYNKTFCAVPFRGIKQPGKKEVQATQHLTSHSAVAYHGAGQDK